MRCGAVEFAALVAENADDEIAVSDIAAAADGPEDLAARCQQLESIFEPSLLAAHLSEKEHRLSLAIGGVEPPAECKAVFEARGGVGESVLPPVGASKSRQGVDLPSGVAQFAENSPTFGEECHRLRQAILETPKVAQAAQ